MNPIITSIIKHGKSLRNIKKSDKTPEVCLVAVQHHGSDLEYVDDQTPEICLAAVKQDGHAIKFVKNQTPEIRLAAVKNVILNVTKFKDATGNACCVLCHGAIEKNDVDVVVTINKLSSPHFHVACLKLVSEMAGRE